MNRSTLAFIREGAGTGDRHRLLFSAAANLAEFGCTPALAVALLEESRARLGACRRKTFAGGIECGLAAAAWPSAPTHQDAGNRRKTASDGSTVKEPPEAAASDSGGLGGAIVPASDTGDRCRRRPPTYKPPWRSSGDRRRHRRPTRATRPTPPQPPTTRRGRRRAATGPAAAVPLPPGAVGSGTLDKPCRCGSTEYADIAISEGRSRRDCRKCGRFRRLGPLV